MSRTDPTTRREVVAVAAFTMAGALVRVGGFGRLGLSHFDEGIYALAGAWPFSPGGLAGIDPMVIPYAPPGFPILVGLAYLILGFADVSAIAAATFCGIATIPAAGWVGRRTFGPGAGAAASAMAAGTLAHIAFSRKALTDAPFVLAWLVAIGLGGRFLERPTLARAIAAGLAVGVAQNFKYNGWLLGVILAGAAMLGLARELSTGPGRQPGPAWRLAALLLMAAATAMLLYVPWYRFVERHGGYAGLVAHHRSYLGGPGSWYPFWRQQLGQGVALSGGSAWDASCWVVAWLATTWVLKDDVRPATLAMACGVAGGAVASGASASLGWWIGLAAAPWLLVRGRPAARLLGCWWVLLSILTPFYHPYARLWLPLTSAGWLLVAATIVALLPRRREDEAFPPGGLVRSRPLATAVVAAVVLGALQQWQAGARPLPLGRLFGPSDTLREIVRDLPRVVPEGSALHVLARRPLVFYLLLQGRYQVRMLSGPDDAIASVPEGAWTIVDGAVADPRSCGASKPSATYRDALDPVTLLDVAPGAAFRESERGPVTIEVFRARRGRPAPPSP